MLDFLRNSDILDPAARVGLGYVLTALILVGLASYGVWRKKVFARRLKKETDI